MKKQIFLLFVLLIFLSSCGQPSNTPASDATNTVQPTVTERANVTEQPTITPSPEPYWPPVTGPQPSTQVAAFYYPWYRNIEVDGGWEHWGGGLVFHPPLDITSDYYPELGAYSVGDSEVLAQHFAWLRQAGVGVIISSWWGRGDLTDQAVPLLLDVADHYGIKVAFHIEPYGGRTANNLVSDIRYLYSHYGDHPAFFRTTETSRWSTDSTPKGVFFLWASSTPDTQPGTDPVEPSYWQAAIDTIHSTGEGAIILADNTRPEYVLDGHFDGCYSYVILDKYQENAYDWALSLPGGAWYVPGINPGGSAIRIGYPEDEYTPRRGGDAFDERWEAALGVGVEPVMVAVATFNEWHEGTQIEPAAVGAESGAGYTYQDYSPLPPDGYLTLTKEWADTFLSMDWPASSPLRVRITTTADWTNFVLVSGGTWLQPEVVSLSDDAYAEMSGPVISLNQPIEQAEAGRQVEVVFDLSMTGWVNGETLSFAIERGHLGVTSVELYRFENGEPVLITTLTWGGIAPGSSNAASFEVPVDDLFSAVP